MFSVLIPVYNHQRYLAQCVLSAVQSPLVSEVLLLDDGSSDLSATLARQLAAGALPKVRDITPEHRGNRGAPQTLNELARHATSPWLAVLNSDDRFTPGRFELVERRIRLTRCHLVFGNVLVIDEGGRQLGGKRAVYDPQLPFPEAFDVPHMAKEQNWLPLLAHQNFLATTSNMVFEKRLFEEIGGFRDFRYVHDWDFCLRAALEGTIEYVPHALTAYRIHATNTIKENPAKVDAEVRMLFDRLLGEYPALSTNREFQIGLEANPYRKQTGAPTLSIMLPDEPESRLYRGALARSPLAGVLENAPGSQYVYSPDRAADALLPLHLANAVLALEMQQMDFFTVSHTLAQPPAAGCRSLRNATILKRGESLSPHQVGRIGRLFPGGGAIARFPFPFSEPQPRETPLPTLLRSPGDPKKPLIFILPALFAVGGVERLVVDMMRQLERRYRFVIVTVERLESGQGALHGAAEGLTEGFYDLAELAPPSLFLPMLERLREVYRPSLVWVPNGSPWQCGHAAQLRALFAGIPIVDQQVYDTEAGWITRYHDPGIRSYDRFIAINRKIQQTFVHRYGLPPERIDLIYHSVNLDALGPALRTPAQQKDYRARYALPEGGQIFGWIGRLTSQKRPLEFLAFAAQAAAPGRHFVMIGNGVLNGQCDHFLRAHPGLPLTRVPFTERIAELLAVMDGLLCCSAYEGLPISMLEALAMGVPIYSTDVGDVELILSEYGAGAVTAADWDLTRYLDGFEQWTRNLDRFQANARRAAPLVRERFGSPAVAAQYEMSFQRAEKQAMDATLY